MKVELTQEILKSVLAYDKDTGVFTWVLSVGRKIKVGGVAGGVNSEGYCKIRINAKQYSAHRLAWLYVHGKWPDSQIDHINGIRADNRIENLRDISPRENQQNGLCHRNGHLAGTSFRKTRRKWLAHIQVNKKLIHLGYFDTEIEAHQAYIKMCECLTFSVKYCKIKEALKGV
jgi:hypothetical protein